VAPARTAPSTYRWQAAHVEGGLNAAADQQSFLVNGGLATAGSGGPPDRWRAPRDLASKAPKTRKWSHPDERPRIDQAACRGPGCAGTTPAAGDSAADRRHPDPSATHGSVGAALLVGLAMVVGGAIAAATLVPMVKGTTGTATP